MRFLPLIVILSGSISLAMILLFPEKYWFAYAGLMMSFSVANFLPVYGPVKQALNPADALNEHDLMIRRNAYFATFATISAVAFLGIWMLVGLTVLRDWSGATLMRSMIAISFYLMLLLTAIPTLYASWAASASQKIDA
ncbi:hypothetical protein QN372_19180 [Undibacterium sp. RTI2.1]|nr:MULTISPECIES: hypothetical protein [unclassified Undibacterium]MDY7538102.1 hypothetical protein [Undibacterium sp. 5I1]MEB0032876.1 hypothetical protein [Undibacterium sp. RTI2.1]MEB0118692.1 hypothetical protein [Undibacterium sp. RTI2.2]